MTVQHLLVPTDFSAGADAALSHAISVADQFGATLHLLHVVDDPGTGWYGLGDAEVRLEQLKERAESEARERMEELARDSAAVEVETAVAQRPNLDIGDAIQEHLEGRAIDLVAMGTRGRGGLGRLILGSVANTLVRRAGCPVMTVRERDELTASAPDLDYENVLAPIDFSDHSRSALRLSKHIVARYGATQHLLFVAEKRVLPTFSDTGIPGVGVVEMDPEIVAKAETGLKQLNETVGGPAVESAYHVREGDVAQDIIDFAETTETDLIVMATRGLTGIDQFVLGSNTERVVRAAPCPVLTVPPTSGKEEE
jgi:nucleotide-binding universal stress UspA family protein